MTSVEDELDATRVRGPVRIGNCSGFYGDRHAAMREMLLGGELDYLTGDYLAELTMLILARDRAKAPDRGYAKTFLTQLEESLGLALDRGVKIVANAGGLNPAGLAAAVRVLADRLGLSVNVAHVEGDDLIARAAELGFGPVLAANAYLGAWGIVDCLADGADVVVTGRVTDASVIVGPAAAHFGWARTDYDALAGAVAAGHVIECGTQATGGNFAFFTDVPDLLHAGFPLAEISADGSSVITKHPGTGGLVSVDTVSAQLLYEIGGARYANPDVTLRLDSLSLEQVGPDRVRLSDVRGEAPPPTLKVSLNAVGGFRNAVTFVLTGLNVEAKADLVRRQLDAALVVKPDELEWTLARTDHPDADTEETASALLRCVVRDPDPVKVGRQFSSAAVELALASYPGFHTVAPPREGQVYGVFTPGYVDATEVPHVAVHADGTRVDIPAAPETRALQPVEPPAAPVAVEVGATRRVPLGRIAGARSGDKGGDANVGVWVRAGASEATGEKSTGASEATGEKSTGTSEATANKADAQWQWLVDTLTVDALRELLPEAAALPITRHLLPNLRAVNFVIEGILGRGVAHQARFDPQAKGIGEWLRARHVDVPEELL